MAIPSFSSVVTSGRTTGMMPFPSSRLHWLRPLLVCLAGGIWAVGGHAEDSAVKRITAGPFSVTAPAAWAERVKVEKVPISPVYTARSWQEFQAREVKRKLSPAEPSLALKPGYANRPEHWAIRFPKLIPPGQKFDPATAGDNATAPQILIHRAAQWAGVYGDGSFDATAAKKNIKHLRRMVENRDPTQSPVFMDAELHFIVEKKELHFSGGHGFRVLAQWSIEPNFVSQGELHYLFLGLSDDNSCQVVATFPIDLPGLPKDSTQRHLGFNRKPYGEFEKQYSVYQRAAKKWLVANAARANPSLSELDAMMSSLVVRKWP